MGLSRWLTLSRSALVGVGATLVDLGALLVLVEGLGVEPLVANVPALIAGLLVQFIGNKVYAFQDRSTRYLEQGVRFAAVEAGAFALNALAFHLLLTLTPTPFVAARIIGSAAVYFGFSYPLWTRIFARARLTE